MNDQLLRRPILVFILAYLVLILGGAVLLRFTVRPTVEILSKDGDTHVEDTRTAYISWGKALRTSTAISCLSFGSRRPSPIIDTAADVSVSILSELAYLLTVVSSLYLAVRMGLGRIFMNKDPGPEDHQLGILRKLATGVLIYMIIIQLMGVFALMSFWRPQPPVGVSERFSKAVYYTISAFTGQGSLASGNWKTDTAILFWPGISMVQLCLAGLMVCGLLGYPVFHDLFSVHRLRERMKDPNRNWKLHTRINIFYFAAFIIVIAGIYYAFDGSRSYIESGEVVKKEKPVWIAFSGLFNSVGAVYTGWMDKSWWSTSDPLFYALLIFLAAGTPAASGGGGVPVPFYYTTIQSLIKRNQSLYWDRVKFVLVRVVIWTAVLIYGQYLLERGIRFAFTIDLNYFQKMLSSFACAESDYLFFCLFGRVGIPILTYYYWLKHAKKHGAIEVEDGLVI